MDGRTVEGTPVAAPSLLWGEVGSKVKIEVRREGKYVVETDHVRRHSEADGKMVHYKDGAIMCGVGIVLEVDRIGEGNKVFVKRVVDGPAAQAGIQSGDEILSIEGVEAAACETMGLMRLATLMVGPRGSIVTIEYMSQSRGGARTAALTRSIDTARAQWPEVKLAVALNLCGSESKLEGRRPGEEEDGKWWGEEEWAFEAVRAGVVAAMGVSCERIKVAGVSRSRTSDGDLGFGQGVSGSMETASLLVLPSLDTSDSTSVWQLLDSLMSLSQATAGYRHVVKLKSHTRTMRGMHVLGWAKTPSEGRRRKRFGAALAGAVAVAGQGEGQVSVAGDGGGSASSSAELPPRTPRMSDVPPEDVLAPKSNKANFPTHPARIGLLRMANMIGSSKLELDYQGIPSNSETRPRGMVGLVAAESPSAFSQSFQSSRRTSAQSISTFSQSFHHSRRSSYESAGTLSESFKETRRSSFENASTPNSPRTPKVIRPIAIHLSSPSGGSKSGSFVQRIALADIASQAQSPRGSFGGRGLLDQTIQGEGGGSRRGSFKGRGILDTANGGGTEIPPPFKLAKVVVTKDPSFEDNENQQAVLSEVAIRQHVETQEDAGPPDTYRQLVVASGPVPPPRLLDHQPSVSKSSPPPDESQNLPSPSKSLQNSMLEVVDVLGIESASPQSLDAMPIRREQDQYRSASVSTPRGYLDHAPEDYPSSNHGGSSMMRQQQQQQQQHRLHHSLPVHQHSPPPPPSPEGKFAMYDAGAKVPIIPISIDKIPKLELVGQDPTLAGGSLRLGMVADSRMSRQGSNEPFGEHQIAPAPQPIGGGGNGGGQARMSNIEMQSLSSPRPAAAAANYHIEM